MSMDRKETHTRSLLLMSIRRLYEYSILDLPKFSLYILGFLSTTP